MTVTFYEHINKEMDQILEIAGEHPNGIRADDLCAELRKRGYASDAVSPASIGLKPDDVIQTIGVA